MADHLPDSSSPTISDLISNLRSSFFSTDFENTTQKLISREENLKKENNNLKKKTESLEEKHKDELKKKETEIDELKKVKCELEMKVTVSEKKFLDLNVRVLSLEKLGKELMSQQQKNSPPTPAADVAGENSKQPLVSEKGDSNIRTETKFPEIIELDDNDDDNDRECISTPKRKKVECISTPKRKKVSNEKKKKYSSDDEDSEGALVFKRKRVSKETKGDSNGDFINKIPTGTQKSKNFEELRSQPVTSRPLSTPSSAKNKPILEKLKPENGSQKSRKLEKLHSQPVTYHPLSTPSAKNKPVLEKHEPKNPVFSLDTSDNSSSDEGVEKVDQAYMSLFVKLKLQKERWETEEHMVKEFEKDDELCMNAICALHRQNTILYGDDISRVNNLARSLGDPQGKLKKTASELEQSDREDIRKFARMYKMQIFRIYEAKKDPFFPPSKS